MRHRLRFAPLLSGCASVLALLAVLRAPARADDGMGAPEAPAPTTREFPEQNFAWTVPAKWTFSDPTDSDKAAGYVVLAKRTVGPSVEVSGYVVIRDAGGVSVEANLQQVKENKSKRLTDIVAKVEKAPWGGAEQAHVLTLVGKAENKSVLASKVFAGIVSGKYHQLELRSANGASQEEGISAEIEAAAKGYHFLAGAKPDEEPAPGAGGDPAGANPLMRAFPKFGLTWTLPKAPEPTPPPPGSDEGKQPTTYAVGWGTEGKLDMGPQEDGILSVGILQADGAAAILVVLTLPKSTGPGSDDPSASGAIQNEENFKNVKDNFDGTPIPAVDMETHIGNALASSRTMSGKSKEGKPLWIRIYATTIKKQLYFVHVEARDRAEVVQRDWLKAALDGLKWEQPSTGVRGPYAAPFPTASDNRGSGWADFNKKAPFKSSAISLTKPPTFGQLRLDLTNPALKGWAYAAETRKPGGLLFVGFMRLDLKAFTQDKKEPESLIDDLETEWKNTIEEPKTRPKSEKKNKDPDSFRGAKGASYVFSGTKEGNPVLERGWVVKSGQSVILVRTQYVGKDAETLLKEDWEALMKTIKFD